MAMGLPFTGTRKMRLRTCGHVVLHGQRAEHEAVARVAADGFQLGLEALVGGEFATQVELADVFFEHAGQIGGAVGNGRVDADVGVLDQAGRATMPLRSRRWLFM
jgi:hypothetical protein